MLESLTEREVVATEMDDNFTIHVFYNKHNNPDYISAIIDAARGRFGERFIEVNDEPEREMLKFTIAYDKHELPMLVGDLETGIPHEDFGMIYCHQLEEIRAVQVTRLNDCKNSLAAVKCQLRKSRMAKRGFLSSTTEQSLTCRNIRTLSSARTQAISKYGRRKNSKRNGNRRIKRVALRNL